MGLEIGGLFGLIVLIADLWAIVSIVTSRASWFNKIVWVVVIVVLPVLGLLIWLMVGPRARG